MGWGAEVRGQDTSPLHSASLQREIKGTDLHVIGSWDWERVEALDKSDDGGGVESLG